MESLSTGTVSTLKQAPPPPPPRIPSAPALRDRHLPLHAQHLFTTKPNSSIPHTHSRPTSSPFTNNNVFSSHPFHWTSHHHHHHHHHHLHHHHIHHPSPPILHRNPAVGYAAALLDVALSNNALHVLQTDVPRFLKLFKNRSLVAFLADTSVGDRIKGEALKEIAEKGKFQKHLAVLLNMLVNKSKVGMVSEVLEEFQMLVTQLLLVSSSDNKQTG
ncbi:hypothetical protein Scep_005975 [Stephania cephalantha]|uniref:Uncharacterized protein n=1 Tax=Stephania cephalantha TaxID=152367 RepID=A0AAP0PJN1_9MAGN